jgi:hypothetical protein
LRHCTGINAEINRENIIIKKSKANFIFLHKK